MENIGQRKFPREVINVILLSLISVFVGFQFLAFLSWVFSHIPLKPELSSIYDIYQKTVHPERDTSLYRIFVITTIVIQICGIWIFHSKFNDPEWGVQLKRYFYAELTLTFLLGFVIFKIVIYDAPPMAMTVFKILLVMAFAVKLSWRFLSNFWLRLSQWLDNFTGSIWLTRLVDLGIPLSIFILLFVPQISYVISKLCVAEGFMHFDAFITSPGWAVFKGCILNIDTWSQYGYGMPFLVASLARILGGYTYENILLIFVWMTIVYYTLIYLFLRLWLKDIGVAVGGTLLAIYATMFSHGADYFVWQFPQSTVVRYFFDTMFFILILLHVRTTKGFFIIMGAVLAGINLFYMNDAGMFILVSFYAYGLLLLILPQARGLVYRSIKDIPFVTLCFILPIAVCFMLLLAVAGTQALSPLFWQNASEIIQFVTKGLNAIPVLRNLKDGQFGYFFLSMGVAVTYVFNLILIVSLNWIKKIDRQSIILAALSVYGLCMYHYYILRSASSSFLIVSVPFVLIICFWVQRFLAFQDASQRKRGRLLFVSVVMLVFFSTPAVYNYPHIFNRSAKEVVRYKKDMADIFISQDDVDLIRRLTKPQDKVCLISSYETATLMAADRKPFFYTFSLVHSRSMKMREFGGWKLITPHQFNRMMNQVKQEKPEYIFIESKLVSGILPAFYYNHYKTLKIFVTYIKQHYRPFAMGKYLVALKLK